MLEQVVAAFEQQDYKTAAQLLQQLLKDSPQDPWVQFYSGRLHEVSGNLKAAAEIYQQLLQSAINRKIVAQARLGLQRLEALVKEQRQQAIAQATADPSNSQVGVLVLEPVTGDKTAIAQKFAQIVQIDSYTARLQLPSRGWRLYRTGAIGELRYLGQNLYDAGVPCFWATLAEVEKIRVFQVNNFQIAATDAVGVICQNEQGQLGSLTFKWSEVTQRVSGLLPIFEQVVDFDIHRKLQRKTQTQDYVQFCDLHLPERFCILRLCDRTYQFQHGIMLSEDQNQSSSQMTTRINWNHLLSFLDHQLPNARVWSDFTPFAQTALDQIELLGHFPSHIHLFRRDTTNWDPAFHLYSGLVFLK